MPSQPVIRRIFLVPVLAITLAAAVAACGGSPKPKASPSAMPKTSSPSSSSVPSGAAESQIKSNWMAFFNAKTPTSQRVKLLQNGQQFATVLAQQAKNPMASGSSAQVSSVTVTSPSQAEVTYSVLVSGSPVLKDQKGVAVKQDGTWKVGDQSFCGLLTMENGGKTSGLPAACHSAGASASPTK
jgi:hypothetical protein